MKAQKATLIAQTIGMYLMHLPLYIFFILEFIGAGNEELLKWILTATGIMMAIVIPICIANIVLSVMSVFKGKNDPSETVMKVKLALIPWYVINFAIGAVIVAIFFNPFMMIGIPVVIAALMGMAYFCMLATSLPDVAQYLRKVRKDKTEKLIGARVLPVVFLFIFCLDVVGSVILYRRNKKEELPPVTEDAIPEN